MRRFIAILLSMIPQAEAAGKLSNEWQYSRFGRESIAKSLRIDLKLQALQSSY
jgi:hypothetical protein